MCSIQSASLYIPTTNPYPLSPVYEKETTKCVLGGKEHCQILKVTKKHEIFLRAFCRFLAWVDDMGCHKSVCEKVVKEGKFECI